MNAKKTNNEEWGTYECFSCSVVFDVGAKDTLAMAQCPHCGGRCELRGRWDGADYRRLREDLARLRQGRPVEGTNA